MTNENYPVVLNDQLIILYFLISFCILQGLNILLNACHSETVSNYFQFLDHVHAVTTSRLKHRAPLSAQRRSAVCLESLPSEGIVAIAYGGISN